MPFFGTTNYLKKKETFEILASFEDIWRKLILFTTPTWQSQFATSFTATFQAAFWEAENAVSQKQVSLPSYKNMRPFFSGANLGTDLIEPASGISLPVYVLQHRSFTELVELIRRVICWANDIFSLEKEIAHGDAHNLVSVLSNEFGTTIPDAILKAAELHDSEIRLYLKLKGELPSFGEKLDGAIQKYLLAHEVMVKGFIDWSTLDSTRYIKAT